MHTLGALHITRANSKPADANSTNWAGYAGISSTPQFFTAVSGSWTVPAVTCTPEHRLVSVWVGLDGAADQTVEQLGTTSECFEGKVRYYSWYEMYPAGSVLVSLKVKPGDVITASVVRVGKAYTLKLIDSTTKTVNNIDKVADCALTTCLDESAEWITERPAYGIGVAPEAQYNAPVAFSHGTATGGGSTQVIGAQPGATDITCVDATGSYVIAATSALGATGASFTNTWKNSW
jgi:hypothetical protein